MSPKHYSQIWTLLGSVLFYYTLNTWFVSQGREAPFAGAPAVKVFFASAPRVESLFALFVCPALLGLLAFIGAAHAAGVGQTTWYQRKPVVWLEGLDFHSRSARVYQGFFLVAFVLLPIAALVHFTLRFAGASVIDYAGKGPAFAPFCLLSCPPLSLDRYVVGDGLDQTTLAQKIKDHMTVDWLPLWEPWVIVALLAGSAGLAAVFLVRVFRFSFR